MWFDHFSISSVKRALKRRGWLEKPCDCCPKIPRSSNQGMVVVVTAVVVVVVVIVVLMAFRAEGD